MIETIVKIRFKQIYRALIGLGLIRIIFLIGLFGFIVFVLFIETSKYPDSYYVTGLTALIILMVHAKRQDKLFLKTNFDNYKRICFVEYLISVSILITFLIFHFQWIPLLLLLSALYLIIQLDLKIKKRNLNTKLQQFIPSECFEWKGGVRQTLFILVTLWIIGFCTAFFIGSVPIVLFILGIIPFSFYEKGEPYQMILAYEMGTTQFLFHKIRMQLLLFSVLTMPLIAAFLVFHFERWYIPIAEYFIFISLYIYLILTKYAFYEPNSKSTSAQIFGTIGVFSGIIPVFLPVVWLLSIRFFFKSKENLNIYLNDYN
ncbi:MAG: hypothetical protein HOO86_01220 [Bacteroidales bacterium]|nr:hypothetical protein [Bacteroidales bacterium]